MSKGNMLHFVRKMNPLHIVKPEMFSCAMHFVRWKYIRAEFRMQTPV